MRLWHPILLTAPLVLILGLAQSACSEEEGDRGIADSGSNSRTDMRGRTGGEDTPGYSGNDRGGSDTGGSEAGSDSISGDDAATPDVGSPDLAEQDVTEQHCGGAGQSCCSGAICDPGLDCVSGRCAAGGSSCPSTSACPVPDTGSPDVPIRTMSGVPPILAGGTLPPSNFELTLIQVYPDAAVSELVTTLDITSNGYTYGSLLILGQDWGFDANLDLHLDITALSMDFPQTIAQSVGAGGCFTTSGNQIFGDLMQCGGEWPEGSSPPESLEYEMTSTGMLLMMVLTREALLASVPEDSRAIAEIAIVGDLPIIFTFISRS